MARIARLAGALLVETQGRYFLVGNPKGPCDLPAAGFAPQHEPIDAMVRPWVELDPRGPIALAAPVLDYGLDGSAAVLRIAEQFLIARNASVSDRLWRLVVGITDDEDEVPDTVDARWLAAAPERVWSIVRDAVLRCT
jgi:hypothetical protein